MGRLITLSNLLFGGPAELLRALMRKPYALVRRFARRSVRLARGWAGRAARVLGLRDAWRPPPSDRLRVLVSGGYGYGNVGDEAQLAANLAHWRKLAPGCRLRVLSPHADYTERMHGCVAEPAPRVAFFASDRSSAYGASSRAFTARFALLAPLLLLNARLMRAGLPVVGLSSRQARLLDELWHSDVLFLSGGGYLTGMTRSRLWDNMLLLRLADLLGVPSVLSGQTIGVFGGRMDRRLARWGLRRASLIYLRDAGQSEGALAESGIRGDHVCSTFDDALFAPAAPEAKVHEALRACGVDPERPYMAVTVHYWGQSAETRAELVPQLARALDVAAAQTGLQVVFVPMAAADEHSMQDVMAAVSAPPALVTHGYQPELSVGVIRGAALCLTMKHHPIVFAMGRGVPTVSLALDDYYAHKNAGALGLFGLADYNVHCDVHEVAERVGALLARAWEQRDAIAAQIRERLDAMRPRAGEPIRRWLRESGLQAEEG